MPLRVARTRFIAVTIHIVFSIEVGSADEVDEVVSNVDKDNLCVKCGVLDIDYDKMEIVDSEVEYPYHCKHCKTNGKMIYKLTFISNVQTD